jgi:hypothetical protein
MNQINSWKVDNMVVNDVKYDNLIESILIEKKSPIKQTLQLLCSKAHYKQEVNDKTITTELEKYFKDLVDSNINLGYSFSSIKDIEQYDADIITQRIFSQEATMYEKIRLKKFYFKKQFLESACDEKLKLCEVFEVNYLEHIWNENYCFFFKQLKMLRNENNIFNKIKQLNDFDTVFPMDVKKTKLNEDIKDLIFKEFRFKYIGKSSTHQKIIKEIYNTYFNKFIITTVCDKNKHISYIVPHKDIIDQFYHFGLSFLKTTDAEDEPEQKEVQEFCFEPILEL